MKRTVRALATTALAAATLTAGLLAGTTSAHAAKAAKPFAVGTDDAGDWGANVDPTIAPLGDALGQDLIGAALSSDGKNLNFVFQLNSLPATGGAPEVSRYTWNFTVNGKPLELDGKFTNYSRGACDPTSGQCPPPRDPGLQPFLVRGNCTTQSVGVNLTLCEELAKIQGQFDPTAGTITVPVPLANIGAKKGTKIGPGTNTFGGTISAVPSAFFSFTNYPLDTLTVTKTYVVK